MRFWHSSLRIVVQSPSGPLRWCAMPGMINSKHVFGEGGRHMARESGGMSSQEETVRLLALLIRLLLPSQTAAILELSKAGFGPARIAELLGTSANTANVALQKAKKKPVKRAQAKLTAAVVAEEA